MSSRENKPPSHVSSTAVTHNLSKRARCIEPVHGDTERNLFLVGTLGFREENEVHLLAYKSNAKVKTIHELGHKNEVHNITASPTDPRLFYTCPDGALYRLPADDAPASTALELVHQLERGDSTEAYHQVEWSAACPKKLVGVSYSRLELWDIETAQPNKQPLTSTEGPLRRFYVARWDTHFDNQIWTLDRTSLRGWDWRSGKEAFTVEHAHEQGGRGLDINRNKTYSLVTAGDDSSMKFWDSRNLGEGPIKQIREAHTHWVTNVFHHPDYDQLVISSGTDGTVKLWDFQSVSSAKPKPTGDPASRREMDVSQASAGQKKEGLMQEYQDHEESVYGLAWTASQTDAWVFGSISYDGRIAFNSVSQDTQLSILGVKN